MFQRAVAIREERRMAGGRVGGSKTIRGCMRVLVGRGFWGGKGSERGEGGGGVEQD